MNVLGLHRAPPNLSPSCQGRRPQIEAVCHKPEQAVGVRPSESDTMAHTAVGVRVSDPEVPNYYGAFVLDADGNNIEAVCHKAG